MKSSLIFVTMFFALATAMVSAQMAPTASEQTKMHWATGQACVDYYKAHQHTPAYVPSAPYHTRELRTGEVILPLPRDAEGCYKQPLPGGIHEWVIRLKDDPTVYSSDAVAEADGRCFNVFEGRILFNTTPAPATVSQPTPTNDQAVQLLAQIASKAIDLQKVRGSNCPNSEHLLALAQAGDTRKRNISVDVECADSTVHVSDNNFKPKPAGTGFWHGLGEYLLSPPVYYPVGYGYGYGGGGYNTYYGGGGRGGGHRGGGGSNTTYGGVNTGGAH